MFCKHDLVKPNDLALASKSTLDLQTHSCYPRLIAAIISVCLRHLSHAYNFALDAFGLIKGTQTPWLNELVWELSMKEYTSLRNTLVYPGLQCHLCDKVLDMDWINLEASAITCTLSRLRYPPT